MNTPNKLTIFRMFLIPVIIVFCIYNFFEFDDSKFDWLNRVISFSLFFIAAFTDFLDGYLARKNNLITDFGKFMDPLADKFLVLGCMFSISFSPYVLDCWENSGIIKQIYFWASLIVLFRELAVTSIRLVVAKLGIVVPANMLGKVKTNFQLICIAVSIMEPIVFPFFKGWFTLFLVFCVIVITIWSGINYLLSYWKYLDTSI